MPNSSMTKVLLPSTTAAADASGGNFIISEQFTAIKIRSVVTAASGTTPTLNIRVQGASRAVGSETGVGDIIEGDWTVYDDYISLTQQTAASTIYASVVASGEEIWTAANGTLAAGQVRNGPIPSVGRIDYTIGGTNPSFTFYVLAELIP